MEPSTERIDLQGVGLRRGQRQILADVSWRVRAGEHWAVIGANGSGKTTLLRLAVGYLWPTDGGVRVLGEEYGQVDLRALRRRIGWVSASLGEMIHAAQTVRQIILSGAFASTALFDAPTPEQQEHAERLIEQFGCAKVADSPFGVISLGERQRALIARALMAEPELLILDEPCAGLDIRGRELLLDRLDHLARHSGHTCLVFVTHHIEEIAPGFTHALVMKDGRVLAQGPKRDVLTGDVLGSAFGLHVRVDEQYGRFWPRIGR